MVTSFRTLQALRPRPPEAGTREGIGRQAPQGLLIRLSTRSRHAAATAATAARAEDGGVGGDRGRQRGEGGLLTGITGEGHKAQQQQLYTCPAARLVLSILLVPEQ